MTSTDTTPDALDTRVFEAFWGAGLWPGLSRTRARELAGIGITRPGQVTAGGLTKLPKVTAKQADRLSQNFTAASPVYAVVELLVPAGLPPRWALPLVDNYGPAAVDVVREDPWSVLHVPEASPAQADALAVRVLGSPMSTRTRSTLPDSTSRCKVNTPRPVSIRSGLLADRP